MFNNKDRNKITTILWGSLFLSFISVALFTTSTLAYYRNIYVYDVGMITTGQFDPDQIVESENPSDSLKSSPLMMTSPINNVSPIEEPLIEENLPEESNIDENSVKEEETVEDNLQQDDLQIEETNEE